MARPNILILMVDQLNGTLFPDGPAEWLHAPNLKRLAAPVLAHRLVLREGMEFSVNKEDLLRKVIQDLEVTGRH